MGYTVDGGARVGFAVPNRVKLLTKKCVLATYSALFLILLATPASAVIVLPGLPTNFEIEVGATANKDTGDPVSFPAFPDPSYVPGTSYDWDTVLDGSLPGPYTHTFPSDGGAPVEVESTGILEATGNLDILDPGADPGDTACNGSNFDTGFGMGAKIDDNPWGGILTGSNNKADACSGAAAVEAVNIKSAGDFPTSGDASFEQLHYVLYNYWTRSFDASGDMTVYQVLRGPTDHEVAGGPEYRCDDILIEFDYDPSGTGVTITSLEWIPDTVGDCEGDGEWVDSGVAVGVGATGFNTDPADEGAGGGNDDTFGESAIDLTASLILPEDECVTFVNEGYITRTGNSSSGSTIDLFGFTDPITINNCTTLAITKAANVDTGEEFTYVVDQAQDGGPVHDDTLTDLNGLGDDTDGTTASITSLIGIGDTHLWDGVIAQIDYALAETILPADWALDNITCTYYDPFVGATIVDQIFPEQDDSTGGFVDDAGPDTFEVPPDLSDNGVKTSCVITNEFQKAAITIVKEVVNDNGGTAVVGDFGLTTSAGGLVFDDNTPNSTAGSTTTYTSNAIIVDPGAYTFSESDIDGYQEGSWSCDGGTSPLTPFGAGGITIAVGDAVTCTISNDDIAPILTLVKEVTAAGGTALPTAWTLNANDGGAGIDISGVTATAAVTNAPVTAGVVYTLSESALAGYTLTSLSCTDAGGDLGVTTGSPTLTLALEDDATCTFVNTRNSAAFTLEKSWAASIAGHVVDLDADGSDAANGQIIDTTATAPSGAVPTNSMTVYSGETVSFSEAFVAPALASNYSTSWSCSDGNTTTMGSTLSDTWSVPDVPAAATCTFTNTIFESDLEVIKTVSGVDDTYAWSFDFALTGGTASLESANASSAGTGNNPGDPVSWNNLIPGTSYTLTETTQTGFDGGVLACVDGAGAAITDTNGADNIVTFEAPLGDDNDPSVTYEVNCAITNTALASDLEVIKTVAGVDDTYAWSFEFALTGGTATVENASPSAGHRQ